MQKCFSNNIKKNRRNSDCVDNDERDMKMTAYQNHFSELHEDLRASLSVRNFCLASQREML